MKKLIIIAVFAFITSGVFAQAVDLRRKIEVTGTAEQEVTPDIIYVSIALKEYMDGKNKITISDLESQLQNAVKEAGIAKENFTIDNLSSYNYTYQKKENARFLASKQYRIKFHDLDKFNDIVGKIDPKGLVSTHIDSYDYSKMIELKRELNTKAIQAARDKASYLLSALGEKLGSVIEVNEIQSAGYTVSPMLSNTRGSSYSYNASNDSDIDIKTMKLDFQVHAVFEIAGK